MKKRENKNSKLRKPKIKDGKIEPVKILGNDGKYYLLKYGVYVSLKRNGFIKLKGKQEIWNKPKKEEISATKKFKFDSEKNNPEGLIKKAEKPKKEIMDILLNPNLFNEITEQEFDKKIVGERETRKVIFLCSAGGRLVENSQIASYNLLINDEAGAGKDYVTAKVLEIIPKEFYIHKTRISPTVFTYWHNSTYDPEWTWDGKVFYPEDISELVLNSDIFKVMCSSGSSATIVIRQRAYEIQINGKPVMITTTATATPNPELTRRFVILNLDSSEQQTKAIMRKHSEFKKRGIIPEYNNKYKEAMRYLKRVKVKIPFAELIDEHFPIKNIVMRTHYPRFLDFISASAGFHQYQRQIDNQGYVLAEGQDYDIARACFIKLCSNKYMIPLTILQKQTLEIFEKNPTLKVSASQFHGSYNIMSLKSVIFNFGILTKYGILQSETDKDSYGRDLEVYSLSRSYNPNEKLEIPTFREICRNEKEGIISNLSIVSKVSKTSIEENQGDTLHTLHINPENDNASMSKIDLSELKLYCGHEFEDNIAGERFICGQLWKGNKKKICPKCAKRVIDFSELDEVFEK